jgi:hypothetical protein
MELKDAVVAARYEEMVGITERIRPSEPAAAAGLKRLVDGFDCEGILQRIGKRAEGGRQWRQAKRPGRIAGPRGVRCSGIFQAVSAASSP